MTDRNENPAIALGPRIVASGSFMGLYREGMTLIEDVAAYLDGDGRQESRGLAREASLDRRTNYRPAEYSGYPQEHGGFRRRVARSAAREPTYRI